MKGGIPMWSRYFKIAGAWAAMLALLAAMESCGQMSAPLAAPVVEDDPFAAEPAPAANPAPAEQAPAADANPFAEGPSDAAPAEPAADDPFATAPSPEDPFAEAAGSAPAQPAPPENPFGMPSSPEDSIVPADTATPPGYEATSWRWPLLTGDLRWGEDVIEQELDRPTVIESYDTELSFAVDSLCEQHRIYIAIDQQALVDLGLESDPAVSLKLAEIPLWSALEALLKPLDLGWTIRHGVLLIASEETAQASFVTKVYNVGDLITCRNKKGEPWDDYQTLVHTITATIEPSAWGSSGSDGSSIKDVTISTAKVLVVHNNYQVHRRIRALLEQLRAAVRARPGDGKPPLRERPQPGYGGGFGGADSGMGGMGGIGGFGGGFF